ncbi:S-layer homology domain-containing protein [Tyzzerella sp. OttesenSCG-928-J15]|nr:S-layer homology domain-containing protein [Tyzzerella sp. OttesenSCG-928-J15]
MNKSVKLLMGRTLGVALAFVLALCAMPPLAAKADVGSTTDILWSGYVENLAPSTDSGFEDFINYQLKGVGIHSSITQASALTVEVDNGYFTITPASGLSVKRAASTTYAGVTSNSAISSGTKYKLVTIMLNGADYSGLNETLKSVVYSKEEGAAQNITVSVEKIVLKSSGGLDVIPLYELDQFGDHYYEYVPNKITWTAAYDAAKQRTFNGMRGYLMTVTSQEEHDFVYKAFGDVNGWAGGTRAVNTAGDDGLSFTFDTISHKSNSVPYDTVNSKQPDIWYWICGPETGTNFFQQNITASNIPTSNGTAINNMFVQWKSGEPNNYNETGEAFLQYGYETGGRWNDFRVDNDKIGGYFVEYCEYTSKDPTVGKVAMSESGKPAVIELSVKDFTTEPASNNELSAQLDFSSNQDGTVSLTIDPTSSGHLYNLVDEDGKVVGSWVTSTGDPITFDDLTPGCKYTIVTVSPSIDISSSPYTVGDTLINASTGEAVSGAFVGSAKEIIAPIKNEVDTKDIYRETGSNNKDTITVDPAGDNLIYGLYDATTDAFLGWETTIGNRDTSGSDDKVTFENLDPSHKYQIVVSVAPAGDELPMYAGAKDGTPDEDTAVVNLPPRIADINNITGGVEDDGYYDMTIRPANENYEYALLDENGDKVKDWQDVSNGEVVFTDLDPDTKYTIVIRYDDDTTTEPDDAINTGADVYTLDQEKVDGDKIKTTTETLTIKDSDSDCQYAILNPETGEIVANWRDGNDGDLVFTGLDSGTNYEIVVLPKDADLPSGITKDIVIVRPGTQATTKYDDITGEVNGSDAEITIDPTSTDNKYAVVDENGNIVGDWKDGNGGGLTFDGLNPGDNYTVVSAPKNEANLDIENLGGVEFIAPKLPDIAIDATATDTTITVKEADASMEYALIGPDGNFVNKVWKTGSGNLVFTGLDPLTDYTIVTRPVYNPSNPDVIRVIAYPGTAIKTLQGEIISEYDDVSQDSSITVKDTNSGMKYAVVDGNGDVAGGTSGWKNGNGGNIVFDGLNPGDDYKVITIPKSETGNASGYGSAGGADVVAAIPPVDATEITVKDYEIIIDNTDSNYVYAVIDPLTGLEQGGGWKDGNGGTLVFKPLAPGKDYEIVVIKKDRDDYSQTPSVTDVTTLPTTFVYPVSYNGNGNTAGTVPATTQLANNVTFAVEAASADFAKTGHIFKGWSDGTVTFLPGEIYTMSAKAVTFTAQWIKSVDVTVTVYENGGVNEVNGASISLIQGNTTVASGLTTGANGEVVITDVMPGIYSLEVTLGSKTVTVSIDVKEGADSFDIMLPVQNTSTVVDVKPNTPPVTVGNFDEMLNDDTIIDNTAEAALQGGGTVKLVFSAEQKDVNDAAITQEVDEINALVDSQWYSASMFLNFSLERQVKNAGSFDTLTTKLDSADTIVEVIIPLSDDMQMMAGYRMFAATNLGVSELSVTDGSAEGYKVNIVDGRAVSISVFTKQMGTFALVTAPTLPNNGNSNNRPPGGGYYGFYEPGYTSNTAVKAGNKETNTAENAANSKAAGNVSHILNVEDHYAYLVGYEGNLFKPDGYMTRAEAAVMFYNLLKDKFEPKNHGFGDVKESDWYAKGINALAELGIVSGYNGNFRPNDGISRAEFVTMAINFAENIDVDVNTAAFSDVDESHWAYKQINAAAKFNWISGVNSSGTLFEPNRLITRAEVVSLVNNIVERQPDKAFIDMADEINTFNDIDKDHWAFYNIMEATFAHDHEKADASEIWKK